MTAELPVPVGTAVTVVVDRLSVRNLRRLVHLFDAPKPLNRIELSEWIGWALDDPQIETVAVCWRDLTDEQRRAISDQVASLCADNRLSKRAAAKVAASPQPTLAIVRRNEKTPKRVTSQPTLALVQQTGGAR